jgi:tetratricopeptide (TPR) repeat protein
VYWPVSILGRAATRTRQPASLLLAAVFLAGVSCGEGSAPPPGAPSPAPPPGPRAVRPEIRRAPDELARAFARSAELGRRGAWEEALDLHARTLSELAALWGEGSPDLAPHYHNLAVLLRQSGRALESRRLVGEARRRWPEDLQLKALAATLLAEEAAARRVFDPQADQLFAEILALENHPRLRAYGLAPERLFTQWGRLRLLGGRFTGGLEVVDLGLATAPGDPDLLQVRGLLFVGLGRHVEGVPLLREAVDRHGHAELEPVLAKAVLEIGGAEEAWTRFSRALARAESGETRTPPETRASWQADAARALLDLGRHREAWPLLRAALLVEPERPAALLDLARASRAAGAPEAAAALTRRARELVAREEILDQAKKARTGGAAASAPYYRALAAAALGQVGVALDLIEDGLREAPALAELHSEKARLHALVGRSDLAEAALERGIEATRSPALHAEKALLLARRGREDEARRALAAAGVAADGVLAGESAGASEGGDSAALRARCAAALLELGDVAAARTLVAEATGETERPRELLLARAEIALLDGRIDLAEGMLGASFHDVPGGQSLAAALRALARAAAARGAQGGEAEFLALLDPSDLVDHPRLLSSRYAIAGDLPLPERVAAWMDGARAARDAAAGKIAAVIGRPPAESAPAYRELASVLAQLGARRKAREAAWYAFSLRPLGVPEMSLLAATLADPEEAVSRLAVLERALRLAPEDATLLAERGRIESFLGFGTNPAR